MMSNVAQKLFSKVLSRWTTLPKNSLTRSAGAGSRRLLHAASRDDIEAELDSGSWNSVVNNSQSSRVCAQSSGTQSLHLARAWLSWSKRSLSKESSKSTLTVM